MVNYKREVTKMDEKEKLTDEELENVSGGFTKPDVGSIYGETAWQRGTKEDNAFAHRGP